MTKLFYTALTLASIMSISAAVILTNHANAQQQVAYIAILNGKNEVPSHSDVTATGMAGFIVNTAKTKIWYQIEAEGLKKVTQAHIHSGKSGENGPVVATLFKGNKDTVNGALVQGSITSDKLVGPLKGKSISDLVNLIEKSSAYVNVHTESFPDGEIRGQISKGTIQIDFTTKKAHISQDNFRIDLDLTNVNLNEITVENKNKVESSQSTENNLQSSQSTENTLGANQSTENTLGANQSTENTLGANQTSADDLGSSQTTENMLGANQTSTNKSGFQSDGTMAGMNESGDSMLGMNQSTESPTTDGSIETPPVG
jgi:CHRD domain-containing protein